MYQLEGGGDMFLIYEILDYVLFFVGVSLMINGFVCLVGFFCWIDILYIICIYILRFFFIEFIFVFILVEGRKEEKIVNVFNL